MARRMTGRSVSGAQFGPKDMERLRLGARPGGEFYGRTFNSLGAEMHAHPGDIKKAIAGAGAYAKMACKVPAAVLLSDTYIWTVQTPHVDSGKEDEVMATTNGTLGPIGHALELELDPRRWKWGRDITNMKLGHCWRPDEAAGVVKTACDIRLVVNPHTGKLAPGRLIRDTSPPDCIRCRGFMKGLHDQQKKRDALEAQIAQERTKEAHEPMTMNKTYDRPQPTSITPAQAAVRGTMTPDRLDALAQERSRAEAEARKPGQPSPAEQLVGSHRSKPPTLPPVAVKTPTGKTTEASNRMLKQWLLETLQSGPQLAAELSRRAEAAGYQRKTMKMYARQIGVRRKGATLSTVWTLDPSRAGQSAPFPQQARPGRGGHNNKKTTSQAPTGQPPANITPTIHEVENVALSGSQNEGETTPQRISPSPEVKALLEALIASLGGDLSSVGYYKPEQMPRKEIDLELTALFTNVVTAIALVDESMTAFKVRLVKMLEDQK